ncbi:glutamine synthetase [Clostridia bacterium]|nr:glutamine synthetase [Clostridia bacterium]
MGNKKKVSDVFGGKVFNEHLMRQRLPKSTFKAVKNTIDKGTELTLDVADSVANVMKDWAIEQGATHFTHWFQPMTGITAEKHDSFISPTGDGNIIMEFSGKELIKGEPDASSFPSGGLRATFEARGYTAWDPTSFAFVKDDSLYVPTAFCSYSGEALDKKTPLLRSMNAVNEQSKRILRLFGKDVERVVATVGAEQEYFLIDRDLYAQREDLIFTGRTLFGAAPPKGQELEDHYFGTLKQRVSDYMKDLDENLWELGIPSKTKHNEVAPSQHENAPVFESANLAADHNQLTMELMQKIAKKHGYAALLHEKPFAGINGSGKHDNWALSTDKGQNLLDPGNSPIDNAQFLTFLAAIIAAVDNYAALLRLSVATAGNDHRLGANEAPPAVISIFLGEELTDVITAIVSGETVTEKQSQFDIGVSELPKFPKDTTDRNRTSPFAFTGNKFEFRMCGSNLNITGPNIILNTIVAEELSNFAEKLESRLDGKKDFEKELHALLVETFKAHKRIIFNGNGYDDKWLQEAEKRGLPNLKSSADALPYFESPESIKLFTKHKVFSEIELRSRTDIMLENYTKALNIEAQTAVDMVKHLFLPTAFKFQRQLSELVYFQKKAGVADVLPDSAAAVLSRKVSALTESIAENSEKLEKLNLAAHAISEIKAQSKHYQDVVFPQMQTLRAAVDELETLTPAELWPVPTYAQLLFSAR